MRNINKDKKKRNLKKKDILFCIFSTLLYAIVFALIWVMVTWNVCSIPLIITQSKLPLQGTSSTMFKYIVPVLIVPTIIFSTITIILYFIIKEQKKRKVFNISVITSSLCASVILLICTANWSNFIPYVSYAFKSSTFIEDNYVEPNDVNITFPEKKKNLIFIFLESTEVTFTGSENGGGFENNIMPELTQLAKDNEDFSGNSSFVNGANCLTGIDCTIASLFAHSSSLPFITSLDYKSMDKVHSFFPGVTNLGDILQEQGYSNYFMCGSDADFAGRKMLFEGHGNYTVYDYYYAKENLFESHNIDPDYRVWWGYEDKYLVTFAKEKISSLAKEDKPFNFTFLTCDTHFDDGYRCSECMDTYDDNYSNVYACSSKRIANFVSWFYNSGEIDKEVSDNTLTVIVGDHQTMDKTYIRTHLEDENYNRKSYVCYINSSTECQNKTLYREYSVLDCLPTLLTALGANVENNRLGLGVNLFSTEETLVEKYSMDYINKEFVKRSSFLKDKYHNSTKTSSTK